MDQQAHQPHGKEGGRGRLVTASDTSSPIATTLPMSSEAAKGLSRTQASWKEEAEEKDDGPVVENATAGLGSSSGAPYSLICFSLLNITLFMVRALTRTFDLKSDRELYQL